MRYDKALFEMKVYPLGPINLFFASLRKQLFNAQKAQL